jgi:hypothetical protein
VSTARKRMAAEAERVRQVNLLARLWQSAAMADALQTGRTAVDGSFADWLVEYTKPYLSNTASKRGDNKTINQTALVRRIQAMGVNARAGERATDMMDAVRQTREVAERRREAAKVVNPFTRMPTDQRKALEPAYQAAVNKLIARALLPYAGWTRLAAVFGESVWQSKTALAKTLDTLRREEAERLDKRPAGSFDSAEFSKNSESF